MIDLQQKRHVLAELIGALEELVRMLALDHRAPYTPFFELQLDAARELARKSTTTFTELKEFAVSLEGLFNRSFLDYSPAVLDRSTGKFQAIAGTERYYDTVSRVSNLALELRSPGAY